MSKLDFISIFVLILTAIVIVSAAIMVLGTIGGGWFDPDWIVAMTGIFALLVSALISFWSFRNQRESMIVQLKFSIRQKQIHNFEENIIRYVSSSSMRMFHSVDEKVTDDVLDNLLFEEFIARTKIEIFLDKAKLSHRGLYNLLIELQSLCSFDEDKKEEDFSLHSKEIRELRGKIIDQARVIANAEINAIII